jgi:hypothetical protein
MGINCCIMAFGNSGQNASFGCLCSLNYIAISDETHAKHTQAPPQAPHPLH